jgi:DNA-binding NtrC family response regulator
MSERVSALLVHTAREPVNALGYMLEEQGVTVRHASTCCEAMVVLGSDDPPHLVFADTTLEDGVWTDLVTLARQTLLPVSVIVVSKSFEVSLYLNTIDYGVFDFVTRPFEARDIGHIVRCAMGDVVLRRQNLADLKARKNRLGNMLMLEHSAV